MLEIKDIAGLGAALTRLIEVVSRGVGAVSSPYLIRKTADARVYEIKTVAKALKSVADQHQLPAIYKSGDVELWQRPEDKTLLLAPSMAEERLARRVDYQERKRQDNLENVTASAAHELVQETNIPEEKPDEDWVSRFFAAAQDVSSQQMQQLWGRILAGEIKKPGSYALRTLDSVRNLSQAEAEVFQRVALLALTRGGISMVAVHDKNWLRDQRQIHPYHHFLLSEVNLMFPTDLEGRFFMDATVSEEVLASDDHMLRVRRGKIESEVGLPVWKFTATGRELLTLIPKPSDEEYLEKCREILSPAPRRSDGCKCY